jgi:putative Ca2+/H+ antiporter (TMEM165/GDT1 family)
MLDFASLTGPFLTVVATLFVVELTDKDAILLLTLAASRSAKLVFAAGSIAFTMTSAIIVLVGTALVTYVPIIWIKVAGGCVMLAYAVWTFARAAKNDGALGGAEKRILERGRNRELLAFLAIIASLALLDLAGDATELLTIVFVAQYQDILLVFAGAVLALVTACGVEVLLGSKMGKWLNARGARYVPAFVLLIIGTAIVATSILGI